MQDKITALLQNVARCRFHLILETQRSSWIYTGRNLMNELSILEDIQSFARSHFKLLIEKDDFITKLERSPKTHLAAHTHTDRELFFFSMAPKC